MPKRKTEADRLRARAAKQQNVREHQRQQRPKQHRLKAHRYSGLRAIAHEMLGFVEVEVLAPRMGQLSKGEREGSHGIQYDKKKAGPTSFVGVPRSVEYSLPHAR
jgi:hypothetical protein